MGGAGTMEEYKSERRRNDEERGRKRDGQRKRDRVNERLTGLRGRERGTERTATYLTFRVATDITGGNF